MLQAEKQQNDANVYKDVSFDEKFTFNFFKISNLKEELVINSLSNLRVSIKTLLLRKILSFT